MSQTLPPTALVPDPSMIQVTRLDARPVSATISVAPSRSALRRFVQVVARRIRNTVVRRDPPDGAPSPRSSSLPRSTYAG
jgi:hypothetical protein